MFDLTYCFGKKICVDDGFQNMFVFQPAFRTIGFKQENNECKVFA